VTAGKAAFGSKTLCILAGKRAKSLLAAVSNQLFVFFLLRFCCCAVGLWTSTMARTRSRVQTAQRSRGGDANAASPARIQSSSGQSVPVRTVPPKAAITDDDLLKLGLETV
jgi:hypothetical protein